MKIIFLDMDGVLCTHRAHYAQGGHGLMQVLDREGIELLNVLCEISDVEEVKYVLSSSWRGVYSREWMETHLKKFGWTGQFHDDWATKRLHLHGPRGMEVNEWLSRHSEVTKYVIFDDGTDFLEEQKPFFIHTHVYDGISFRNFEKAVSVLHGDFFEATARRRHRYEAEVTGWSERVGLLTPDETVTQSNYGG